ncbi:MAG: ABC transporter substrate-binding protein [Spirochaetes bacterium]|nr:ABC transporter substrate-binding protein [Spirochaetota bacterium]
MKKMLRILAFASLCMLLALPVFAGGAKETEAVETKPAAESKPAPAAAVAAKYKEAPVLAELVKAGKLPPVDQRLPENPLVVPGDQIGQYGGVWRRGFLGPSDFNGVNRVIYDVLVRFGPNGATIEMKLAESVTPSADYRTWTVKLRKGSKGSDGSPFSADDIMYWYKDVLLNKDLVPAIPSWMQNKDGTTGLVEKVDDLSARWTFKDPNTNFLLELTTKDYGDRQYPVFQPSKYMKQFHAAYAKKEDLDKMVAEAKFKTWVELYANKQSPFDNPERPGMAAWVASNRISEQIFILKRNPYFVGVDKAGNQLPYLDEVQLKFFTDAQALNLAAIAGELDEQERHVNLLNFPVLKENEQKLGKYKIYLWSSPGGQDAGVVFNQTYAKDPELGKLFATRDFRIAMSQAINRNQINESAFLGTGEPRQSVPKKGHPYYPGDEYAFKYTQYNPEEAGRLLDSIGLDKKDSEGFRLFPSGRRVAFELPVVEVFGPYRDIGTLITRDFERVGIKATMQIRERALHFQMRQANDLQAELWNQDTAGFPFTGSTKYDFRKDLYGNLTYGPLWKPWFDTNGKDGVEPPPEAKKIIELQDRSKTVGPDEKVKIAQEIFRIWVDNMFEVGTVGLTATDQGVAVVNAKLQNVPIKLTKDWPLRTPGNGRPEVWFFK